MSVWDPRINFLFRHPSWQERTRAVFFALMNEILLSLSREGWGQTLLQLLVKIARFYIWMTSKSINWKYHAEKKLGLTAIDRHLKDKRVCKHICQDKGSNKVSTLLPLPCKSHRCTLEGGKTPKSSPLSLNCLLLPPLIGFSNTILTEKQKSIKQLELKGAFLPRSHSMNNENI